MLADAATPEIGLCAPVERDLGDVTEIVNADAIHEPIGHPWFCGRIYSSHPATPNHGWKKPPGGRRRPRPRRLGLVVLWTSHPEAAA